jgi:uncharacterized protein
MCRRWLPLLLLFCLLLPTWATAQPARPAGFVNDRADLLSAPTVRKLESFLRDFDRSDSTQLVVLTVPTLEGEPIESYALRVAESWGIGRKGKDNGALLLVAREERAVRIEVGYGLEGRLTDLLAGRIIDQEITPRFRDGDFDGGVIAGVSAMAEAVRGEYQGSGRSRERQRSPLGLLALLLFLGPGLLFLTGGRQAGRGYHRRGSTWIGHPPVGGRRGGGFGGGGFGGFGGGGFGGGGASGRW